MPAAHAWCACQSLAVHEQVTSSRQDTHGRFQVRPSCPSACRPAFRSRPDEAYNALNSPARRMRQPESTPSKRLLLLQQYKCANKMPKAGMQLCTAAP